jgi:regulator of protease activity HflC (stomatin/prohibitin superfamily)
MNPEMNAVNREKEVSVGNGWAMLAVTAALFLGGLALVIVAVTYTQNNGASAGFWLMIAGGVLAVFLGGLSANGYFTLQPNEAQVLVLFGAYHGTVRKSGFHWANPFYSKSSPIDDGRLSRRARISLRSRTLNGDKLKVNDKGGNPIEIAAILIWRVQDTAQAVFDVNDYEKYVATQTESAVRHLASCYSYDHGEENEVTLRSGVEEVQRALQKELQDRLLRAGITVEEARLTHLAYAPEIAQAMLRRQQAEAVIAARQKIVQGAVSMVDMALKELALKQVVNLDDERKAAMVSNLMVVLCGESEVHPVVNTGTLYT